MIRPLSKPDDAHQCYAEAVFKIETHEYRQRAQVSYVCPGHLGGSILAAEAASAPQTAALPRWVVTRVPKAIQ